MSTLVYILALVSFVAVLWILRRLMYEYMLWPSNPPTIGRRIPYEHPVALYNQAMREKDREMAALRETCRHLGFFVGRVERLGDVRCSDDCRCHDCGKELSLAEVKAVADEMKARILDMNQVACRQVTEAFERYAGRLADRDREEGKI